MTTNEKWTEHIGMDAEVHFGDGSKINVGDAIYHPKNVERARLIAASPELARLLGIFVEAEAEPPTWAVWHEARALLARIKGESNE